VGATGQGAACVRGGQLSVFRFYEGNVGPGRLWGVNGGREWGLALSYGPSQTRDVGRGWRRFIIRDVQRPPGWVERVLRRIKVGLGQWRS